MLDKALESVKTIKLTGGIFGKTFILLMVLCVSLSAVCFKADIWWLSLILFIPLMGIVTYAIKRCFDFAEKNPHAAIMDGAELLVHERIIHGQKGLNILPNSPATIDHQPPALLPEEIEAEDTPPPPLISNGSGNAKGGAI